LEAPRAAAPTRARVAATRVAAVPPRPAAPPRGRAAEWPQSGAARPAPPRLAPAPQHTPALKAADRPSRRYIHHAVLGGVRGVGAEGRVVGTRRVQHPPSAPACRDLVLAAPGSALVVARRRRDAWGPLRGAGAPPPHPPAAAAAAARPPPATAVPTASACGPAAVRRRPVASASPAAHARAPPSRRRSAPTAPTSHPPPPRLAPRPRACWR